MISCEFDSNCVLQLDNERFKQSRDTEERLMVTAWYNMVCVLCFVYAVSVYLFVQMISKNST